MIIKRIRELKMTGPVENEGNENEEIWPPMAPESRKNTSNGHNFRPMDLNAEENLGTEKAQISSQEILKQKQTESEEEATKKIQLNIRRKITNPAKLSLKAKKEEYKKDPNFIEVLNQIDRGSPEELKEKLLTLTKEQFLFTFRHLTKNKDPQGRLIIGDEIQKVFEKHLIDQLSLKDSGFTDYKTFDTQGISELVEYYKLAYSELDNCEITTLLNTQENWEGVKEGTGENFFIVDQDCNGKDVFHVTGLYVNYDNKTAYFFDSLGDSFFSKDSNIKIIQKIRKSLGEEFVVISGTVSIQKDLQNCMLFAMSCLRSIAKSGPSFSTRLKLIADSSNENEILQHSLIPETVIMAQSMSIVKKYDDWFSLIENHSPDSNLDDLGHYFNNTFKSPLLAKLQELKTKTKKKGIVKKKTESKPKDKKEEEIKKQIQELTSFRNLWLKVLHEDRELLSRVSNQTGTLRENDGAIRLNESGKEENFLIQRMRLRVLYYMATKRS
ncbi:hypothetical protein AB751O23_AA_00150 [Chlamydiales bacterium SCGC AB-751-O23]|jgi:hypothetical protein|nr:hypothetical protein AB751O23_AA_00150 [Chlamydiales bacterium SCGC AB-751-O23]